MLFAWRNTRLRNFCGSWLASESPPQSPLTEDGRGTDNCTISLHLTTTSILPLMCVCVVHMYVYVCVCLCVLCVCMHVFAACVWRVL